MYRATKNYKKVSNSKPKTNKKTVFENPETAKKITTRLISSGHNSLYIAYLYLPV